MHIKMSATLLTTKRKQIRKTATKHIYIAFQQKNYLITSGLLLQLSMYLVCVREREWLFFLAMPQYM